MVLSHPDQQIKDEVVLGKKRGLINQRSLFPRVGVEEGITSDLAPDKSQLY